jgi:ATP-dependent exoDNAse (exonuclease V) beta subunit
VAADVVDFKTDDLDTGDHEALQKRVEVYKPQIQSYRDAVAAVYGLRPDDISARLMFVTIDRQVPID